MCALFPLFSLSSPSALSKYGPFRLCRRLRSLMNWSTYSAPYKPSMSRFFRIINGCVCFFMSLHPCGWWWSESTIHLAWLRPCHVWILMLSPCGFHTHGLGRRVFLIVIHCVILIVIKTAHHLLSMRVVGSSIGCCTEIRSHLLSRILVIEVIVADESVAFLCPFVSFFFFRRYLALLVDRVLILVMRRISQRPLLQIILCLLWTDPASFFWPLEWTPRCHPRILCLLHYWLYVFTTPHYWSHAWLLLSLAWPLLFVFFTQLIIFCIFFLIVFPFFEVF